MKVEPKDKLLVFSLTEANLIIATGKYYIKHYLNPESKKEEGEIKNNLCALLLVTPKFTAKLCRYRGLNYRECLCKPRVIKGKKI